MRFIEVTKPGIIFGNMVTVLGGFLLASHYPINELLLLKSLVAMALIIGSGCVFNNYIDKDIDVLMERTQRRVLVRGLIPDTIALIYAALLALLGFALLYHATNARALCIAMAGYIIYAGVYTLWFKRHSLHGTAIGGIAGAVPPVVGYCAAGGALDSGALVLFLILFCWQMPHFYAISIYRCNDYAAANIPILPLQKTVRYTKFMMLAYTAAFTLVVTLPTWLGYANFIYGGIALSLGLIWCGLGIQGFKTQPDKVWSRKMFLCSIVNIMLLCLAMGIK